MNTLNRVRTYSTLEFYDPIMTRSYSASDDDLIASALIKENMGSVHTNSSLVQTYIATCLTQRNIKLDKIKSIEKAIVDFKKTPAAFKPAPKAKF